ncbi:hypothetical protein DFJ74DRAFT_713774 [Hyaloraphidium curvatum]|nr:hypothetical protein DFJ74DRAFT_713774 [Hyaloraphidium curvatum]
MSAAPGSPGPMPASEAPHRDCPVCLSRVPSADGVSCTRGHFACGGCFAAAMALLARSPGVLGRNPGALSCCDASCDGGTYDVGHAVGRLPTDVLGELLAGVLGVMGDRAGQAGQRGANPAALPPDAGLEAIRDYIQLNILSFPCPGGCGHAHFKVGGCEAMRCPSCHRSYCSLCMVAVPRGHLHVIEAHGGGFFHRERFHEARRRAIKRQLVAFLVGLDREEAFKARVVDDLREHFGGEVAADWDFVRSRIDLGLDAAALPARRVVVALPPDEPRRPMRAEAPLLHPPPPRAQLPLLPPPPPRAEAQPPRQPRFFLDAGAFNRPAEANRRAGDNDPAPIAPLPDPADAHPADVRRRVRFAAAPAIPLANPPAPRPDPVRAAADAQLRAAHEAALRRQEARMAACPQLRMHVPDRLADFLAPDAPVPPAEGLLSGAAGMVAELAALVRGALRDEGVWEMLGRPAVAELWGRIGHWRERVEAALPPGPADRPAVRADGARLRSALRNAGVPDLVPPPVADAAIAAAPAPSDVPVPAAPPLGTVGAALLLADAASVTVRDDALRAALRSGTPLRRDQITAASGGFRAGDPVRVLVPRGALEVLRAVGVARCSADEAVPKGTRDAIAMEEPAVDQLAAHLAGREPPLAEFRAQSDEEWRRILAYGASLARGSDSAAVREVVPLLAGREGVPPDREGFIAHLRREGLTVPTFGEEGEVWNFLAACAPALALRGGMDAGGGVLGRMMAATRRREQHRAAYARLMERLDADMRSAPVPIGRNAVRVDVILGMNAEQRALGDRSYHLQAYGNDVLGNLVLAYVFWARLRAIATPRVRSGHQLVDEEGGSEALLRIGYQNALARALHASPLPPADLARIEAAFVEMHASQARIVSDAPAGPVGRQHLARDSHAIEAAFRRAGDREALARVLEARTAELELWSREGEFWPRPGDRVEVFGLGNGRAIRFEHR